MENTSYIEWTKIVSLVSRVKVHPSLNYISLPLKIFVYPAYREQSLPYTVAQSVPKERWPHTLSVNLNGLADCSMLLSPVILVA